MKIFNEYKYFNFPKLVERLGQHAGWLTAAALK